jgi:hypothetical protein
MGGERQAEPVGEGVGLELGSGIFFGQITEQVGIDKAIDATIKGLKIDSKRQLLFGRPAAATTAAA